MNDEQVPDGFEEQPSRFVVGIDLGTTNCAVAYLDTHNSGKSAGKIQLFPVQQWVDFGTSEKRDLLPSFLYQPLEEERQALADRDGEPTHIVGALARDRGLQMPGRQVSSAKSWLCHDGVDRASAILPWQSDDGVEKLSPVEASGRYLNQIRVAWDRAFPKFPLGEQDVVLTLPASFDQVARRLTLDAAEMAGLKCVLPIEEPQAAFYAWLARHKDSWESKVLPGQTILVCDIGGGTTDFTLIRVRETGHVANDDRQPTHETLGEKERNKLSLHRVAVGQHLILGGDNIDLALAKLAEHKISPGKNLPPRAWDALRQACRVAKEKLLGDSAADSHTIHLPGTGARLIGGGQQVVITANEVAECVLEGFFPACDLKDRPELQQVGFQEFGLPFATDASITKHLASFLWDHRQDGRTDQELAQLSDVEQAKPDWILFNGGVMTSSQLCSRLINVVGRWFESTEAGWQPKILDGERLDLAVAFGATYFGQVRRGEGVAIEAKLACSYYLQTDRDPPKALCIVPGSASPGETFRLESQPFELSIGQPVQFPVFYSGRRLADRVGDQVELDQENFSSMPPIRTVLELSRGRKQDRLPVVVEVELTQIGTLQMYCQSSTTEHRWKLEFDIRGTTQSGVNSSAVPASAEMELLDEQAENTALETLRSVFGETSEVKPARLMRHLSDALELGRTDWPPSLLRAIWAGLMELQEGRRKSESHEARWLNLLGYALRPGYGLAADDWRVAQTWRSVQGKLAFASATSRNESLILWRRIAGGFTAGQQLTVYQQIAGPVRGVLDPKRRAKGGGGVAPQELIELLRLLGSLELLPKSEKNQLGDWLIELLSVKKWSPCCSAALWALGRLGARVPVYGPLNCVVDAEHVSQWLRQLCDVKSKDPNLALALTMCGRRVNDRYRDISETLRVQVLSRLEALDAPEIYKELVRDGGAMAEEMATQIVGESLPLGLVIA